MSHTESVYRQHRGHLARLNPRATGEASPGELVTRSHELDDTEYFEALCRIEVAGAAAGFHVISCRDRKSSLTLTTDVGVASWGGIVAGTAAVMLDPVLHRSVITIAGDGSRLQAHQPGHGGDNPEEAITNVRHDPGWGSR